MVGIPAFYTAILYKSLKYIHPSVNLDGVEKGDILINGAPLEALELGAGDDAGAWRAEMAVRREALAAVHALPAFAKDCEAGRDHLRDAEMRLVVHGRLARSEDVRHRPLVDVGG